MPGRRALHSSSLRDQAIGLNGAAFKTAGLENLSVLLFWIAVSEFATVAATTYATSLSYSYVVLQVWPPSEIYGSAALFIAFLIVTVSLAFRHYFALQTQPLHRFLWNGIGAVGLAFSLFLSSLFLLKVTEEYSRATFFIQLFAVTLAVLALRTIGHTRNPGRYRGRAH